MSESVGPARLLRFRALRATIVLCAACAYARTAPRWILGGDNGEFAALYETGGIAHPPGFPTMVLWLRLWHWLPVATPALGAALATVLLGAAAVWALQWACLAWGASQTATIVVSAAYAFSPMAWKMSCHAEAFAMNALFGGILLALSAPVLVRRAATRCASLGLLAGLAIANHQTIVLLLPVGLLAAVRTARGSARPWLAVSAGVAGLIAGLVPPYVYVYWLAKHADPSTTPMWINAPTLSEIVFLFRRGAYGTLTFAPLALERHPWQNVAAFLMAACQQTLGLPLVILAALGKTLVAPGWVARPRVRSSPSLQAIAALAASFVLAGPIFVATFNLPFVDAGPTIAERFYLLPEMVLSLLGALSIDALLPASTGTPAVAGIGGLLVAAAASAITIPKVLEYTRPTVELYVKNTLLSAPPETIVVGTGDHRVSGFLYARYALHLRPDVTFVNANLLAQPWYRRDLHEQTGVNFETPEGRPVGPKTTLARLWATGRPVAYTDWPDPSVAHTPHVTVGTLMFILGPHQAPPDPDDLERQNVETFSRYTVESKPPEDRFGWGRGLVLDYARAWGELGQRFAQRGQADKEQECYRRAAAFAPWSVQPQ